MRTGTTRLPAHAAFTLVEVVISGSLMALILTSGYLCLNAAISAQRLVEPRVELLQNARVALGLMSADLRNACSLSKDYPFFGMHRTLGTVEADNLDFATHNYAPRRALEGDYCQVSFFLQHDARSGQYSLWRRRNPRIGLNPLAGGVRDEIARGLLGMRFEYYDGLDWYESWGDVEGNGKAQTSWRQRSNLYDLPEAVRVTLWLDPNPRPKAKAKNEDAPKSEPPLVFQTVARLNLAARVQQGSSGGGGTSSSATADPSTGGKQ